MAQGHLDLLDCRCFFSHGSRAQVLPDAVDFFCVFFWGNVVFLLFFYVSFDGAVELLIQLYLPEGQQHLQVAVHQIEMQGLVLQDLFCGPFLRDSVVRP